MAAIGDHMNLGDQSFVKAQRQSQDRFYDFWVRRHTWPCYARISTTAPGTNHQQVTQLLDSIAGKKYQDWGSWMSNNWIYVALPSIEVRTVFLLATQGYQACDPPKTIQE